MPYPWHRYILGMGVYWLVYGLTCILISPVMLASWLVLAIGYVLGRVAWPVHDFGQSVAILLGGKVAGHRTDCPVRTTPPRTSNVH